MLTTEPTHLAEKREDRSAEQQLLDLLKAEAVARGKLAPESELDPATAFRLVRDMPYQRAGDRRPETIIREWRGTCSGKHYLLKELFAELGLQARVMACTSEREITAAMLPPPLHKTLQGAHGSYVDVHNYIILDLPEGEMIVDATWPVETAQAGMPVNERFVLGEDHRIAVEPIETWIVPEGKNPQDFKDQLLAAHFTPEQLEVRELYIGAISLILRHYQNSDESSAS